MEAVFRRDNREVGVNFDQKWHKNHSFENEMNGLENFFEPLFQDPVRALALFKFEEVFFSNLFLTLT